MSRVGSRVTIFPILIKYNLVIYILYISLLFI